MKKLILLLLPTILLIGNKTANAQNYIPGFTIKSAETVLQDIAKLKPNGNWSGGKFKGEEYFVYTYEKWSRQGQSFTVTIYTRSNGKIMRVNGLVNNASYNNDLAKKFFHMIGSLLSANALQKFNETLSPWIKQHYVVGDTKKYSEASNIKFRGINVKILNSGADYRSITLVANSGVGL